MLYFGPLEPSQSFDVAQKQECVKGTKMTLKSPSKNGKKP